MNQMTKGQIAAAMRHYGNSAASFVVGAVVAAIVLGYLSPDQTEHLLQSLNQAADGFGKLLPLLLVDVPFLAARSASNSASPVEQVRRVEENVPGVVVTPVTKAGAELVKEATGADKPVQG